MASPRSTWGVLVLLGVAAAYIALVVSSDKPISEKERSQEVGHPDVGELRGGLPFRGDTEAMPEGDANLVPHPSFPKASPEVEKLFAVEEPDRGPWIKSAVLPPARSLRWSSHGHCEVDGGGLICGPPVKNGRWRLGRSTHATVARVTGGDARTILVEGSRDIVKRIVELDAAGLVVWSRSFREPGTRYTSRRLDGGNQLPGCGMIELAMAADRRASRSTCLQWGGEPMRDRRGVVSEEFTRDANGFVVASTYRDAEGHPVLTHDGVSRVEIERDEQGRPVVVRQLDAEGAVVPSANDGCGEQRSTYDPQGNLAQKQCLGDGARVEQYGYDPKGCLVREAQVTPAKDGVAGGGEPAVDTYGVHRRAFSVDAACRPLIETCEDGAGKPWPCRPGEAATTVYTRDPLGRTLSARHRDVAGNPAPAGPLAVVGLEMTYDDLGNRTSVACFDAEGKASQCSRTGFHRRHDVFDDAGRRREERYFDQEGEPATNLGIELQTYRYDGYDHLIEERNEPWGQYAARRIFYDPGHRRTGFILVGRDGGAAMVGRCFAGMTCPKVPWHAVSLVRDRRGRVVRNRFFDDHQRLIFEVDCRSHPCDRGDD